MLNDVLCNWLYYIFYIITLYIQCNSVLPIKAKKVKREGYIPTIHAKTFISVSWTPSFHKYFKRGVESICCPLTMMSHKRFFKNGSKAVISMPFLSNFLFSYVFIFEMAMIAIHFCPHSTAGLNEPFITNFLSFGCSWFYFLCNFFISFFGTMYTAFQLPS